MSQKYPPQSLLEAQKYPPESLLDKRIGGVVAAICLLVLLQMYMSLVDMPLLRFPGIP